MRDHPGGILLLCSRSVTSLLSVIPPLLRGSFPEWEVLLRQIYFTAFQPLWLVVIVSSAIGAAAITQLIAIAGTGGEFLAGKIMVWVVVRELAPLIVSLVVIARSGSAIAAELSQMKISGELRMLAMQGIEIDRYLVGPRLIAATLSVVSLTLYFCGSAVVVGYLAASLWWHVPLETYRQGIMSVLTIPEIMTLLLKSAILGFGIATICCHQGLSVGSSVTQIPQATTRGVMYSLLWVFTVELTVSLLTVWLT